MRLGPEAAGDRWKDGPPAGAFGESLSQQEAPPVSRERATKQSTQSPRHPAQNVPAASPTQPSRSRHAAVTQPCSTEGISQSQLAPARRPGSLVGGRRGDASSPSRPGTAGRCETVDVSGAEQGCRCPRTCDDGRSSGPRPSLSTPSSRPPALGATQWTRDGGKPAGGRRGAWQLWGAGGQQSRGHGEKPGRRCAGPARGHSRRLPEAALPGHTSVQHGGPRPIRPLPPEAHTCSGECLVSRTAQVRCGLPGACNE